MEGQKTKNVKKENITSKRANKAGGSMGRSQKPTFKQQKNKKLRRNENK